MLKDINLKKAVSSILQRSEKQQDTEKLVGTFVDMGILPQIKNLNNRPICPSLMCQSVGIYENLPTF